MACQKVCKQGRDDIIVKVNSQSPIPTSFYTTVANYCENNAGMRLCEFTFTIIERFHVTSSPLRLRRKMKNSHHVGVQRDRSFYGNLHKMSDILIMILVCIESDKIPSLHKFKKLYKRLPVGFLIDIAYTANNILFKLYTKMAVRF